MQQFPPLGSPPPPLKLGTNKKNPPSSSLSVAGVFHTLSCPQHPHDAEKETEARGHRTARWGLGRAPKHLQEPTTAYLSATVTRASAQLRCGIRGRVLVPGTWARGCSRTVDKAPTWASLSLEHSFQPGYSLPPALAPPLTGGPGGVGCEAGRGGSILWFSKHDGRLFKQVELTLFSQVPKHLAGHLLSKSLF